MTQLSYTINSDGSICSVIHNDPIKGNTIKTTVDDGKSWKYIYQLPTYITNWADIVMSSDSKNIYVIGNYNNNYILWYSSTFGQNFESSTIRSVYMFQIERNSKPIMALSNNGRYNLIYNGKTLSTYRFANILPNMNIPNVKIF
jgi:hypothetical protein